MNRLKYSNRNEYPAANCQRIALNIRKFKLFGFYYQEYLFDLLIHDSAKILYN